MLRGVKGECSISTVWHCVCYCAGIIRNGCWILLGSLVISLPISFPFWATGMDIVMDLRYNKSFSATPVTTFI